MVCLALTFIFSGLNKLSVKPGPMLDFCIFDHVLGPYNSMVDLGRFCRSSVTILSTLALFSRTCCLHGCGRWCFLLHSVKSCVQFSHLSSHFSLCWRFDNWHRRHLLNWRCSLWSWSRSLIRNFRRYVIWKHAQHSMIMHLKLRHVIP